MLFDYSTIGRRIKKLRGEKGMTQEDLAWEIEKCPSYISYLETGLKCMSLTTLIKIANVLDVSTDLILADCLTNHTSANCEELEKLMSDCSVYESRVIIDVITALKQSMRDNRFTDKLK